MEFFHKLSAIDFMAIRKWTAAFSMTVFALSLFCVFYYGLNLGLDFTGGTQLEVAYTHAISPGAVRHELARAGFDKAVVQSYGTSKEVLVSIPGNGKNQATVSDAVMKALPGGTLQQKNYIGPAVGKELASKGTMAIIISLIATMIYIMMRFEWRFAISSTVALIHDPVLILGVFAYFQLPFDMIALGALLAILGYSLNDTIVVFDRVRENFRKVRKQTPLEIVNLSINQTLSRTVMTSGLTLIVVIALFVYGGETLKGFSTALIVGIVIGTYSSIYVAGALAVAIGLDRKDFLPKVRTDLDAMP